MATSTANAKYYIGLMSGTSADGIDLALVSFDDVKDNDVSLSQNTTLKNTACSTNVVAHYYQPYSEHIATQIMQLYNTGHDEIDRAFSLDVALAHLFFEAIKCFLEQEQLTPSDIIAIGNHGQTIRHRPSINFPFTLQIGCCQTLATLTGIRVIGQFRKKDIALGGQGAPLVPAFHDDVFSDPISDVFVVNIGGIANITYLPSRQNRNTVNKESAQKVVIGFDTGPGNALMDEWYLQHNKNSASQYDKDGVWASTGEVNTSLLKHLMSDEYFLLNAPKSTGREYFNLPWLRLKLAQFEKTNSPLTPQSIQATLTMLTAESLCKDINDLAENGLVYLCGGGIHNKALMAQITSLLCGEEHHKTKRFTLLNTLTKNIDGDLVEAVAFAWLAFAYDHQINSNMPAVTGASKACTLGTCFTP